MRPIALYPAILTLISLNKQMDNLPQCPLFFLLQSSLLSPRRLLSSDISPLNVSLLTSFLLSRTQTNNLRRRRFRHIGRILSNRLCGFIVLLLMLVFVFMLVLLDGCLGNKLLEEQIVALFFGGSLGLNKSNHG